MIYESAEQLRSRKTSLKTNDIDVKATIPENHDYNVTRSVSLGISGDIYKAYIPFFLYKPPFGYPRRDIDINNVRKLAATPWIWSIKKSIKDRITAIPWDIVVKDDKAETPELHNKILEIKKFFENPNANFESFADLQSAFLDDILVFDSGVIEKIFDNKGDFKQLMARPGETFLKNTDIHGTIQNRDDFVDIQQNLLEGNYIKNPNMISNSSAYNIAYSEVAAYFQYGWTPGSMPVPFGKRELIYGMLNPRADSIYGTSPVQILYETILTLIYGSRYHLDMYINNNIPQGIISLINANQNQIDSFKQRLDEKVLNQDTFDQWRNKNFTIPVINQDAKFTPWQLPSKQMEILEQQRWFWKLAFACFGINSTEMGDTEDTSKANGANQTRILKTKAIQPILMKLQYIWNTQVMPELDPEGLFEFVYKDDDTDEDLKKNQLYQLQMAYMTINEIREKENLKPIPEGDVLKGSMNPFGSASPGQDNSQQEMPKDETGDKENDSQEQTTEQDADKKDEEESKLFTKAFKVTDELAQELATQIGFTGDMHEFKIGLMIEQEHDATVKNDILTVAKIAKDHLDEKGNYYTELISKLEPDKARLLEMKAMPKSVKSEDDLAEFYKKLEKAVIGAMKE